ncbi:helix-turn-helix domain-containing protein [Streptomyces sp.]|uniref:helix-turn-helix domain-containing protein n=1 Tax=Streptomyces sp. TaxID=1931 RepID=UPI002F41F8AA
MLNLLGLDELSLSAYRVLLHRPNLDMAELAEELGVDRAEVADIIDQLKRLSLIRPRYADPGLLHAVSPEIGLRQLIKDQEDELDARRREIERARTAVDDFADEYSCWRSVGNEGKIEYLTGVDAIHTRIEELAAASVSEIVTFSVNVQTRDSLEPSREVEQAALNRGVALRAMYLQSIKNHPQVRSHVSWLVDQGAQVRVSPLLPLPMVIFDQSTALLPIDPDTTHDSAMVVSGKGLLTAFLHIFDSAWSEGQPIGGGKPAADGELGATDQAVLSLLAQGMTDEAVARKLGVSLRTVRRMMARLMRQLGTRSRFEAGIRVAQLGLMHSDSQAV